MAKDLRLHPHIRVVDDRDGGLRAFRVGQSEAALLSHMLEVERAIDRGTATYAHEDVVLHYLRMYDKDWS